MLQPCFPGLISSEDGVDCKLCPAGFSCDTATGALYLCPAGQYSPEGVLQCLSCPADYVCTAGFPHKVWIHSVAKMLLNFSLIPVITWSSQCEPGKEPNTGNTECRECPPGFYSTPCTVWCLQCPPGNNKPMFFLHLMLTNMWATRSKHFPGSFCPDSGMFQPLPCPPGSSSALGQTHCQTCNDTSVLCGGAMAPRWSHSVHRSVQPSTCRPGTYKPAKEDLSCITCPRGFFSPISIDVFFASAES